MFFNLQWKFVRLLSIFILLFPRKDDDVDLNASPQALDRLLGCFLAFKVKVQPRFMNAVVLKYSDESNLINVVLDMLPGSEVVFCQVYFSYCDCMHIFRLFLYSQFIYHEAMLQDREFNTWVDRPYRAWICKLTLSSVFFLVYLAMMATKFSWLINQYFMQQSVSVTADDDHSMLDSTEPIELESISCRCPCVFLLVYFGMMSTKFSLLIN